MINEIENYPLVSCIMPTTNRKSFVKQAIKYFDDQDYPNKELIIVADKPDDLPKLLAKRRDLRIFILNDQKTIGAKRNLACGLSKGSIIIHWDDDDWYSNIRIKSQVQSILEGKHDMTALTKPYFFSLYDMSFWKISKELNAAMFAGEVMGGSLAFKKSIWSSLSKYPSVSIREDIGFLDMAMRKGASLKLLDAKHLYVYVRHNNTWKFKTGHFLKKNDWWKINPPDCMKNDLGFYRTYLNESKINTISPNLNYHSEVRVSCIMPTANRAEMVEKSIQQFLKQEYKNKELIIVDDGNEDIKTTGWKDHEQIQYFKLDSCQTIGSKRNFACSKSNGDIIIHWDDDDWYSSDWIKLQVKTIHENQADICGLNHVYFLDTLQRKAWEYVYPAKTRSWVHGATMAYTKSYWKDNPFEAINEGEDIRFLWSRNSKKIIAHEYSKSYLGLVHKDNASSKQVNTSNWFPKPFAEMLELSEGFYSIN